MNQQALIQNSSFKGLETIKNSFQPERRCRQQHCKVSYARGASLQKALNRASRAIPTLPAALPGLIPVDPSQPESMLSHACNSVLHLGLHTAEVLLHIRPSGRIPVYIAVLSMARGFPGVLEDVHGYPILVKATFESGEAPLRLAHWLLPNRLLLGRYPFVHNHYRHASCTPPTSA